MRVYRIVVKKYSKELSGFGAAVYGARWNSAGIEMVYTSEHRSLALCEILVHIKGMKRTDDYRMLCIDIPDKYPIGTLDKKDYPKEWTQRSSLNYTQDIGDAFIRQEDTIALKVPSVIIPQEYNVLLNPYHPKFKYVKLSEVEILTIDKRLADK